jgi:hypothetical protein
MTQKTPTKETEIIINTLEALEGILYAARQQIMQQYAPQDYSKPETPRKEAGPIELLFPPQIADMLNFSWVDPYTVVKPKQFLGADNFNKVAGIVRGAGGEYVSAGKESHFRIRKK